MAREIPRFISVDDHVVEPPHLFQRWLPAKYRDDPRAPRVERRGIGSMTYTGGTSYDIVWDDSQPKSDTWFYEELVAPHKRHVASVGFARDDMTLSPITYDEMRPGLLRRRPRGSPTWTSTTSRLRCASRRSRASVARRSSEASDKDLALACVHAYNDWMVEEWCGDSGGRLIPLCLVPCGTSSWATTEGPAVTRARRTGGRVPPRSRGSLGPADQCTRATGSRSSPPARRRRRWCACTSGRRRRCPPRRPTRLPRSRRR